MIYGIGSDERVLDDLVFLIAGQATVGRVGWTQVEPADHAIIGGAVGFRDRRQDEVIEGGLEIIILDTATGAEPVGLEVVCAAGILCGWSLYSTSSTSTFWVPMFWYSGLLTPSGNITAGECGFSIERGRTQVQGQVPG